MLPTASCAPFSANRKTIQCSSSVRVSNTRLLDDGFARGRAPEAALLVNQDLVTVFVPRTPNPTSGTLVMVPRSAVRPLEMTIDEAFTFVLSAGSVTPTSEQAP